MSFAEKSQTYRDHALEPRRVAGVAIAATLKSCSSLDEHLEHAFQMIGGRPLDERDRALARAIAVSAFRRLGTLRQAIAARLARSLPRRVDGLESILVAGAAQILLLDVPDHAAVNAAVEIAKADVRTALLRRPRQCRVASDRVRAETDFKEADPLATDTPAWLRARWTRVYGEGIARAIANANAGEPAIDVTVKDDPEGWATRLGGMVVGTGSVRLGARTPIAELPGFPEGAWWVQDAAASLPARVLQPRSGERVADFCAAPGGKTAQLAAAGAEVLAVDRSPQRLRRLEGNLERLGLAATVLNADALLLEAPAFDAILLDAPCTATGTIRRHPDVAWLKTEDDLAKLADLQGRLLDKAFRLLKPGGRLVFSTCSLEPEEGEEQVAALLERAPGLQRLPIAPGEAPGLAEAVTRDGDLRILPFMMPHEDARFAGVDGFFVSRLVHRT